MIVCGGLAGSVSMIVCQEGNFVPSVDYMLVADRVHSDPETGKQHILGAGCDRITAGEVPTAQGVGVALRLTHTRAECGREHRIELIFQNEDGGRVVEVHGAYTPQRPEAGSQ